MQCFLLPGKALGPFRLGSTLRECISELQFNSRDFKQVNTTFNIDDETADSIVLDIKTCGIFLRFDSIQQRLILIDVYDLTKISIYYHKQLLTAPPSQQSFECNTFARIYNIMGLTHPGFYDTKRGLYYVEYEGLWLSFLLSYDPGPSSLPVDLNDGTSPILNRLIVFYGKNGLLSHELPRLGQTLSMIQNNKISATSIPLYSYYFEPIYVNLNQGIRLFWRNRNILFGCSVQDVLSDIGPPFTIHYKDNINYFFNYIDLGLDILFDGHTHTIVKFILHTNCVGHPDFNRWCKCNFNIVLFNDMNCVITSSSKWKHILKYMGPSVGPPIMYRSSHGKIQNKDDNDIDNDESIRIYGYQSVLFEIMGNESISTVTLFHEKNYNQRISRSPQSHVMRMESIVFDEEEPIQSNYKLPEPSPSKHHHHSPINPSPLSISIEEAAKSQLQFVNNDKYSLKNKAIKKKKNEKIKEENKSGAIEIDHIISKEINDDDHNIIVNDDENQNEMFDNIKL